MTENGEFASPGVILARVFVVLGFCWVWYNVGRASVVPETRERPQRTYQGMNDALDALELRQALIERHILATVGKPPPVNVTAEVVG